MEMVNVTFQLTIHTIKQTKDKLFLQKIDIYLGLIKWREIYEYISNIPRGTWSIY